MSYRLQCIISTRFMASLLILLTTLIKEFIKLNVNMNTMTKNVRLQD